MLRPVGNLPPSVYRRRRLSAAALALALVVLLGWLVFGRGHGGDAGAGTPSSGRNPSPAAVGGTPTPTPSGHAAGSNSGTGSAHSARHGRVCAPADLRIEAATGRKSYPVGAQPDLYLQVTNTGGKACRQNLADRPIEMRITIAGVRVWGSHDCAIEPGTDVVKLLPRQPVRRAVVWSGLTSTPGCKGTRLRAAAGVYDLTSALDGRASAPVAFTITARS